MFRYTKKILVFFILFSSSEYIFSYDGGKVQSTIGTTGVINVASADVVSGFSVGTYIGTDFSSAGFMPRLTFGWKTFEFFGGFNYGLDGDYHVADGNVGIKWKFYENKEYKIRIALLFNMQFNSALNNTMYYDGQVLFVASWNIKQFETHMNLGATFGDYQSLGNLDVGIGMQWWFLDDSKTKGIFNLAMATDFTNFDFKVNPVLMNTGSAEHRGKFSAALRFGFLKKTLILDIGGMDLFDKAPSFYTYIGYNFNI